MAKNTKKKAKFKEVTFTINKGKFKELLALILKHNSKYSTCGGNILNGVQMSVKDKTLTLAATNGRVLLEVETELQETVAHEAEAVLVGVYLEKLTLKKDYYLTKRSLSKFDNLEITIKEELTVINDVKNQIKYDIPYYLDKFPNYKKLFPEDVEKNKDYVKVGINMALLSNLSALTQRGVPSIMAIKDGNSAVVIKANYNNIKSRALVMPCVVRE